MQTPASLTSGTRTRPRQILRPGPPPRAIFNWTYRANYQLLLKTDRGVIGVGEAERAEVHQVRLGSHQVGPLVQRNGVALLPDLLVDLVGQVGGLLRVELGDRLGVQVVDLLVADL